MYGPPIEIIIASVFLYQFVIFSPSPFSSSSFTPSSFSLLSLRFTTSIRPYQLKKNGSDFGLDFSVSPPSLVP